MTTTNQNQNPITIRRAVGTDWSAIRKLARLSRSHLETGESWIAKAGAGKMVVAALDGTVVGYAIALGWSGPTIHLADSPERAVDGAEHWHIHDVTVSEDHRGLGIGSRLLMRCVREGERAGFRDVHAVATAPQVRGWMESNGFVATGPAPYCYGPQARLMEMSLQPAKVYTSTQPEPSGAIPRVLQRERSEPLVPHGPVGTKPARMGIVEHLQLWRSVSYRHARSAGATRQEATEAYVLGVLHSYAGRRSSVSHEDLIAAHLAGEDLYEVGVDPSASISRQATSVRVLDRHEIPEPQELAELDQDPTQAVAVIDGSFGNLPGEPWRPLDDQSST